MTKKDEAVTQGIESRPLRPGTSIGERARLLSGLLGVRSPSGAPIFNWGTQCANTAYPHPDEPARADRDEAVSPVVV